MRRFLYLILGTLIFVSCAKEWEAPEWTITDGERTFERKDTPLTREQAWQVVKHYFYGDDEGNIVGDVVESLDILEPNVIIDSIAVQLAIENGWTDVEFRRSRGSSMFVKLLVAAFNMDASYSFRNMGTR